MPDPIEFEVVDPPEADDDPPRCETGPVGHQWRLTVTEGTIGLTSGCKDCDDNVLAYGGDDIYMEQTLTGRMVWEPDHPNLGGWHGLERCDCGWQWRFDPESIEAAAGRASESGARP